MSFPCPECQRLYDAFKNYNDRYTRLQESYVASGLMWEKHKPPFSDMPYPPKPVMNKPYEGLGYQKDIVAHMEKCNYHKKHSGNGTYSGPFAFTLTKSPTDNLSVGDMLKAVEKIMNQKSCPVAQYAWHLEYKGVDEEGLPAHPHIHGMYETHTQGRIEAKHFKRAWPVWNEAQKLGQGFRGGYHRPVKAEEGYKDYIKKDGGISKCLIQPDE